MTRCQPKLIVQLEYFCLFPGENISLLGNGISSHVVPSIAGIGRTNYPTGSVGMMLSEATLASISQFMDSCIQPAGTQRHIKLIDLKCTMHFGG